MAAKKEHTLQIIAWIAAAAAAIIAFFAYIKPDQQKAPAIESRIVMPKIENNPHFEVNVKQEVPAESTKAAPALTESSGNKATSVTNNFVPQIQAAVPTNVVSPLQPSAPRSPVPGGDWPALDQTYRIEIKPDMLPRGATHSFEFYQNVEQGDRLRIHVTPVNGADMKTEVDIRLDGDGRRFDNSRIDKSQHWTMNKAIPGKRVVVAIKSWSLGLIDVRVEKAN